MFWCEVHRTKDYGVRILEKVIPVSEMIVPDIEKRGLQMSII